MPRIVIEIDDSVVSAGTKSLVGIVINTDNIVIKRDIVIDANSEYFNHNLLESMVLKGVISKCVSLEADITDYFNK